MKYERFKKFKDFYPFYLQEHTNKTNRLLHFIGVTLFIMLITYAIITKRFMLIWLCPIVGYGFAWTGHFIFEKNKPASFAQPIFSLMGDFLMWWQLLTKKINF